MTSIEYVTPMRPSDMRSKREWAVETPLAPQESGSWNRVWVLDVVICAGWKRWCSFEGHGYEYLGGTQRTISDDVCGDHSSTAHRCVQYVQKNFASASKNL